ncbi:MAG: hypothetical protein QOH05_157 [Acetobacteraceae bacterium]|jgi:hypothetical protein|nr:hypothetical protein [Acetobacteraceae bacterium]
MRLRGDVDERQGAARLSNHTTAMPPIIALCLISMKTMLILMFSIEIARALVVCPCRYDRAGVLPWHDPSLPRPCTARQSRRSLQR